VIIFNPLTKKTLEEISNVELKKVVKLMNEKKINLYIHEELKSFLVNNISLIENNKKFGARPLKRLIQNCILNHMANFFIEVLFFFFFFFFIFYVFSMYDIIEL
jgi:ATP-dependent Clp protease ATP-binding subunit ClpA